MLGKILILCILTAIYFLRLFFIKDRSGLLSYWILLGLSGLSINIFAITSPKVYVGQFSIYVGISILGLLLIPIALSSSFHHYKIRHVKIVIFVFSIYFLFSLLNPNNVIPVSSLPPLFYFVQLLCFILLIKRKYSRKVILAALYDALSCWIIFELILVICYPLLGLNSVASLFHGESAEVWSMRRDNYASAIGSFGHPAGLAFVCSCYSVFYMSLFISNYRKRESLFYFLSCVFIVFFTYSRTSYIALFLASVVVYLLSNNSLKQLKRNVLRYALLLFAILYGLTYIPIINNLFFESDASQQVDNRLFHYLMGWEMFSRYPLLGLGINSHVYYIYNNLIEFGLYDEFWERSPIHNSHLILLVETGLIGFLFFFVCQIAFIKHMLIKNNNQNEINISYVIIIGLLFFNFVYGFFGWSIFNVAILSPFAILIGLMWDIYIPIKRK